MYCLFFRTNLIVVLFTFRRKQRPNTYRDSDEFEDLAKVAASNSFFTPPTSQSSSLGILDMDKVAPRKKPFFQFHFCISNFFLNFLFHFCYFFIFISCIQFQKTKTYFSDMNLLIF